MLIFILINLSWIFFIIKTLSLNGREGGLRFFYLCKAGYLGQILTTIFMLNIFYSTLIFSQEVYECYSDFFPQKMWLGTTPELNTSTVSVMHGAISLPVLHCLVSMNGRFNDRIELWNLLLKTLTRSSLDLFNVLKPQVSPWDF